MNGSEMHSYLTTLVEKNELPIYGQILPTNCSDPYYIALWSRQNHVGDEIKVTILGKNRFGRIMKSNQIILILQTDESSEKKLPDYINEWILAGKQSNRMHRPNYEVDFELRELTPDEYSKLCSASRFTH